MAHLPSKLKCHPQHGREPLRVGQIEEVRNISRLIQHLAHGVFRLSQSHGFTFVASV